jgi:hypothetical protein
MCINKSRDCVVQHSTLFYVLLKVHLGTILVNDQLEAQFFSYMFLFQLSTCFEQPHTHHQQNKLYQYNIWYVPFFVGDRLECRSERNSLPDLHTRIVQKVCPCLIRASLLITLQFRLVHSILNKNLNTQSLLQHITSKNTSNILT